MSGTVVSVLTPPGTGAIATVEVRGPRAWELARTLFKPAGKPLPEAPEINRFWFGTLGADEVVLAVTAPDAIEVHCHGGRRVVRWVVERFLASGGREPPESTPNKQAGEQDARSDRVRSSLLGGLTPPARLLQFAPTLRTANIILDQLNGAFALEVQKILQLLDNSPAAAVEALARLAELGNTIGRHLIEPWKVVIAGAPNVGKSSLVNALAGYQRAVVSEVAGTTRDTVSVRTAFDGWPVELIDTAGLREAEGLEAEGIKHAKRALDEAELVVWVVDGTAPEMEWPADSQVHVVVNKSDALNQETTAWMLPLVSARTGEGIPALTTELVARLVPNPPTPGNAVPYTPRLIELVQAATAAPHDAARLLREALAIAEAHTAGPSGLPSNP